MIARSWGFALNVARLLEEFGGAMMDAGRRRRYMMGMCDAMGIALHRLTGLPLVKVIARKRSVDPDFFEWDISEEEAAELFTVEGVTEEQIEEAVDDALADPVLAPILEKMR
jgi:hypothetical protein